MNLTVILVTASILGLILPGVLKTSTAPMVASLRSNNFAQAELLVNSLVLLSNQASSTMDSIKTEVDNIQNCDLYLEGTLIASSASLPSGADTLEPKIIKCTSGSGKYQMSAERSFILLSSGSAANSLGVYSDDDLDGFDDVTGLFTHYAECYSGWKGSGTLKNNCDLGGQYVIPAYSSLYN